MSNIFVTIVSLSISGSLLALILFTGKLFLKNGVTKAFSYYIWLLVLLRLILPVAAPINVVNTLFVQQQSVVAAERSDTLTIIEQTDKHIGNSQNLQTASPETQKSGMIPSQASAGTEHLSSLWNWTKNYAPWIWLAGAVMNFAWFITAYASFTRRMRRSCVAPHQDDLAVFRKMSRNKRVRLACSSYAATPVLIGIIHPIIVLPQFAYVQNTMENQLRNILRHELTHYRRKDVLYKWSVAAITSLHWFNPFMLLIRREIGKACELSCDEAVVSKLSAAEKQKYGNTLLTFSSGKKLPAGILATTLSEGKAELKERLVSIMKYKKKSAWTVAMTLALTLLLVGCAATLGAANSSEAKKTPAGGALPAGAMQSTSASSDVSGKKNATGSSSASDTSAADATTSTALDSTMQKWTQLDRLHYIEGSVQSFQKNTDGTETLSLKISKNYHNGTDPIDDPDAPFSIGTTQSFTLQTYSEDALQTGAEVVIYGCNVSPESDQNEQFAGAAVLYYKENGTYVDGNGKEVSMPPVSYPEFQDVFQ